MYEDLDTIFRRHLSGAAAQRLTASLTEHYRSPGSSGYHAATRMMADAMRRAGADRVTEVRYPLDGATKFCGRTMPPAWEPVEAELALVEPAAQPVISYPAVPSTLPWWCGSTPPEGMVVPLVDVGRGLSVGDYAGKPARGSAVLIRDSESRPAWAHAAALAKSQGAVGIVTDFLHSQFAPWRTRESVPDAVQLLRLPPAWTNPWAFAVGYETAEMLAPLARRGTARVRARVVARTFAGDGVNLMAAIDGATRPEESVLFIAHTSAGTRPGANCAAGPALMAELCRSITAAIAAGELARPARSISFLLVVEGLGSAYFLETHRDTLSNIKAVICLDSVGHHQDSLKSSLVAYRVPDSTPSYVNDVSAALIDEFAGDMPWPFLEGARIPLVNFHMMPYTPWSDNHYWGGTGVPAMLVMSWPDRFFHTQLLTVDHTDPAVFERCGRMLGALAVGVARTGPAELAPVLYQVATQSAARVGRVTRDVLAHPEADPADGSRAIDHIRYLVGRDTAALYAGLELVPTGRARDQARGFADQLAGELQARADLEIARIHSVVPAARTESDDSDPPGDAELVPCRAPNILCPGVVGVSYEDLAALVEAMTRDDASTNWETLRLLGDELWNFADGHRTIGDIARAIGFEFELYIRPERLVTLARGLERAGAFVLEATPRQGATS